MTARESAPSQGTRRPASGWSLAAASYVFAVVMMGTTMPTPLYPLYEEKFGFGSATTTVLFAIYAFGVNLGLVFLGRLSDAVGRRPMLLAGVVLSLMSAAVFTIGTSEWLLYTGRVLSGFAAGIFTSAGTVVVIENAPPGRDRLAAAMATAANMGGLGLGTLMAGSVAEISGGAALRSPFVTHAVLLVIGGAALVLVRDRVTPDASRIRLQVPGLPRESRTLFWVAAVGAAVGFTMSGIFSSIIPNFMGGVLHDGTPALVGLVIFALFGASAAGQILLRGAADRTLILWGSILLVVAMGLLAVSVTTAAFWALVLSAALGGLGQGLLFMTGMRALSAATRPENRTEAASAYFVVAYLSISVPSILAGLLSRAVGLEATSLVVAVIVSVATLLGLVNLRRFSAAR